MNESIEVLYKIKSWVESNNDSNFNDEERLIKRLADIGFEDSEKFYSLIELIISKLQLTYDDERVCYSLPKQINWLNNRSEILCYNRKKGNKIRIGILIQ